MKQAMLRLRLVLRRADPLVLCASALLLALACALGWTAQARRELAAERVRTDAALARRAAAVAGNRAALVAAVPAPDRLAAFHGALGERARAEEQVRTLFALAARAGLVLREGEYKSGWDRNARVATYQVTLPVRGGYGAVWEFALAALRAIPFAALDDISFRRDSVGDAVVEARLRLTLYLRDGAPEAP